MRKAKHAPAYVYRLRTYTGELAFVGSTTRLVSDRLREHRHRSWWWDQIDTEHGIHAEGYASAAEAEAARVQIIATEAPRFNVHKAPKINYGGPLDTAPPTPILTRTNTAQSAGGIASERFNRKRDVQVRTSALTPTDRESAGGFIFGDVVRRDNPFRAGDYTEGRLIGDRAAGVFQIEDAGGRITDVDDLSELTLITPVDGEQQP